VDTIFTLSELAPDGIRLPTPEEVEALAPTAPLGDRWQGCVAEKLASLLL
jgi:hypothetical protein